MLTSHVVNTTLREDQLYYTCTKIVWEPPPPPLTITLGVILLFVFLSAVGGLFGDARD